MSKIGFFVEAVNWKTIWFNFKYLPWKQAIQFPIVVSRFTRIRSLQGTLLIDALVSPAMIKIGFDGVGIFDNKRSRSIWQNDGKVLFKGKAIIGHGSKICVGSGGILVLGNNFIITAESQLVCSKAITFGEHCLLSWDTLITDTDFHIITDFDHMITNENKPIIIEDHVWVGCRTTILKGVHIFHDSVIAAGSVITRDIEQPYSLSAEIPNRIIRQSINWKA